MFEFFKHSNYEGKAILLWLVATVVFLLLGIFNRSFLIVGVVTLAAGFISCIMFLPDAQFGKDDPPDENALL